MCRFNPPSSRQIGTAADFRSSKRKTRAYGCEPVEHQLLDDNKLNINFMNISGSTKLTGLFGYPVGHTVSPLMHNAAFTKLKIDCVYMPLSIHPKNLKQAVESLETYGFIGINVTIPHKQTIMKYLDKIMPAAKRIGAVNTVLIKNGKMIGYNTDGLGFVKSVEKDCKIRLKGKTMFLLGAGGAGRAISVQSGLSGLKKIYIFDTLEKRAQSVARSTAGAQAIVVKSKKDLKDILEKCDIIVNATPIGLHKKDPISIPMDSIPSGKIVYDLIYNPKKTKLLMAAEKKRCKAVNGRGMLLYQGAASFQIWTGKKAPVSVMKKAIK